MARAQSSDYFHSFHFHVTAGQLGGADDFSLQAGFSGCTLPEKSVEVAEYKEGIHTFSKKYPGNPSVTNFTLSRGVAKADTKFADWMNRTAAGQEYRSDLTIYQFHREDFGTTETPEVFGGERSNASRVYLIYQAFPSRFKPGSDLDPNSADISIQELDIECENFDVRTSTGQ